MSINFVKTEKGFVPVDGGEAVITKNGLELRGKVKEVKEKAVKKVVEKAKVVKEKLKKKK